MPLMVHTPSFFRRIWPTVLLCAAAAAGSSGAWAQATRTWVSGVGDDVNPCSRTAPCKTFAGAISKTAANGEINVLDPAGVGSVTITKSMLIDGTGVLAGVLVPGTNGIIVNAGASDTVVLRHLDIVGVGTGAVGVKIIKAGKVVLDNVRIQGFSNAVSVEVGATTTVLVQNSQLLLNTGAIHVADAASKAYVSNTTVFGNSTVFSAVAGAKILSFNNNRLEGNTDTQSSTPTETVYER